MDGQRFDRMAKAVGRVATRRVALRRLGGGLAGGALAALGLGRTAVRAEATCPECRRCINRFFGRCTSICARVGPDQDACGRLCCEESLAACTSLRECTAECTAHCPGGTE